jgi:WD40 repeat protein
MLQNGLCIISCEFRWSTIIVIGNQLLLNPIFTPIHFVIAASSDSTARLWSTTTGEDIKVYQGHHKSTICCALHDGAEPGSS